MPDLTSKPHAVVSVEDLRNFAIQHSVTITEDTGRSIDAVPLNDLVDYYEQLTGRDFYKNRAAPAIPGNVEDAPPHTFANYTPSGICGCGDRNCQGHSE